jgi:hypothetical protein
VCYLDLRIFFNSLKVHRERLELEAQLKAAEAQQVMPRPAPLQFTRLAIPVSVRTTQDVQSKNAAIFVAYAHTIVMPSGLSTELLCMHQMS